MQLYKRLEGYKSELCSDSIGLYLKDRGKWKKEILSNSMAVIEENMEKINSDIPDRSEFMESYSFVLDRYEDFGRKLRRMEEEVAERGTHFHDLRSYWNDSRILDFHELLDSLGFFPLRWDDKSSYDVGSVRNGLSYRSEENVFVHPNFVKKAKLAGIFIPTTTTIASAPFLMANSLGIGSPGLNGLLALLFGGFSLAGLGYVNAVSLMVRKENPFSTLASEIEKRAHFIEQQEPWLRSMGIVYDETTP